MKINTNTLWETRANEISYLIKYFELWERKIYFAIKKPNEVNYNPHFNSIDHRGTEKESFADSRHIEVVTFDYSDNRTITHLIDKGILIKEKTKNEGTINIATSLIGPPVNTIPATYTSYADKRVLDKFNFEGYEMNSESYPGGNKTSNELGSEKKYSKTSEDLDNSLLELSLVDTSLILTMKGKNYFIVKMRYGYENFYVLSFLLENPNRDVTDKEIKDRYRLKVIKPFPKTLDNVHIVGLLRDVFFVSTNNVIRLNNPIKLSKLKKLSISPKDLIPRH